MLTLHVLLSDSNKQKSFLNISGRFIDFIMIPTFSSLPSRSSSWRVSIDFPTPVENYTSLANIFQPKKLCAITEAVSFEALFAFSPEQPGTDQNGLDGTAHGALVVECCTTGRSLRTIQCSNHSCLGVFNVHFLLLFLVVQIFLVANHVVVDREIVGVVLAAQAGGHDRCGPTVVVWKVCKVEFSLTGAAFLTQQGISLGSLHRRQHYQDCQDGGCLSKDTNPHFSLSVSIVN